MNDFPIIKEHFSVLISISLPSLLSHYPPSNIFYIYSALPSPEIKTHVDSDVQIYATLFLCVFPLIVEKSDFAN